MSQTDIFVIGTIVLIGLFDFYIIIKNGKQASVSAWFIRNAKKYASIAFLMGFVMGHLFWPMSEFDYTEVQEMVEKCEKFIKENKN